MRMIVVKDGDEIALMAQMTEPTVFDPAAVYGSVMRVYRIVATKSVDSTFELVPLSKPQLVSDKDTQRVVEKQS